MSKKKRRQPPPRPQRSETGAWMPREAWRDAEARMVVMEHTARLALANKDDLARIVVPVEAPRPPILLPARHSGILFGPDGRPLNTEGAI